MSFRKYFLLAMAMLCLALPFAIERMVHDDAHACLHEHNIPEIVLEQYCPPEGELEMCFVMAQEQNDFCQCEEVARENLLLYKSNRFYDSLLGAQIPIGWIMFVIIGGVLVALLIKISYLIYLVQISRKGKLQMGGKSYTILYPQKPMSVGSFRLLNPYIIWQNDMDKLSREERDAILWHEISHLRQRDTLLKVVLHFLQTVWLLNPAFYLLRSELHRLSEHIADEYALAQSGSNAKRYAALLVKMKRTQLQAAPALAYRFGAGTGELKSRVLHLLNRPKEITKSGMLFLLLLLFIGSSFTAYYSLPAINEQLDDLKMYEKLAEENRKSGKDMFCKHCLLERDR